MLSKSKLAVLFVAILFAAITFGQTRDEFRRKYGAPDDGGYVVRPGIVMTVLYSEENQAQEFKIVPKSFLKKENSTQETETMSLETASEIIDEIMPIDQRGGLIREIVFNAGCTSNHTLDYEKVSIYRTLICTSSDIKRVSSVKMRKK